MDIDRPVDRWLDRWIDGWRNGWIDRWVDRWIDRQYKCRTLVDGHLEETVGPIKRFLNKSKNSFKDKQTDR